MRSTIFGILIFILLSQKTYAQKEDLSIIPNPDKIMMMYTGQKAPWPGILMDDDEFRYLKTLELENDSLSHAVVDGSSRSFSDYVWVFLGGAILGIAGTSLAK